MLKNISTKQPISSENLMRVAQYVKQFRDAGSTTNALVGVAMAMLSEAAGNIRSRQLQELHEVFPILEEIVKKWKAFAGRIDAPPIDPDGFEKMIELHFADLYAKWMRYRQLTGNKAHTAKRSIGLGIP